MKDYSNFDIQDELKKLPEKPGVYMMKDENDDLLYVGKAIILKNRVKSYFQKNDHSARIQRMISHIHHFEYIITDSEYEALLLENNLIKQLMPPFNVLLKDDKGYPYIKVTKEDFPRVSLARRISKDGSKYFGPYFSSLTVNMILDSAKNILPLRKCNKKISAAGPRKDRPCLNYHIGLCPGVCGGHISKEDYDKIVKQVYAFLSGKYDDIEQNLKEHMLEAAQKEEFEKAALYRDRLNALSRLSEKQKIESSSKDDYDVAALAKGNIDACIQIFFVRNGKICGRDFYIFPQGCDEDSGDLVEAFIKQFYRDNSNIPKKIYTEDLPGESTGVLSQWLSSLRGNNVEILTPEKGHKRQLLTLARENAGIILTNKEQRGIGSKGMDYSLIAEELSQILQMENPPLRIEAYDISNLGGSEINGSMVVFENGMPLKSAYKRFKITSLSAPDDVGSVKEVLTRRFERLKSGSPGFEIAPDLILIDGGRNQCAAAREVIKEYSPALPVFGMVKDNKHTTRGLTDPDKMIFELKQSPELWNFISSIQNEAHRFAIEYNKKLREKRYKKSVLDGIPGVGNKRKVLLLRQFKSISAIRNATKEQLMEVKGINSSVADNIIKALAQGGST